MFKSVVPLFFLMCPFLVLAQIFNADIEAKIDVKVQGEVYEIFFSALNKTQIDKSLDYESKIIKKATANLAEEKFEHKDFFVLKPNEKINLTSAKIIPKDNQRIIVFLLIYDEGKPIGKDRIVINGMDGEDGTLPSVKRQNQQNISKATQNEVNLMQGVVVEDTKTKPGRDFYQYFFLEYNAQNINGEKIVKISEELAIGGNTMIKIFAGNDLVSQFFVNPRATYLKDMAINSVSRLNYYFRQNRAVQQDLIKY